MAESTKKTGWVGRIIGLLMVVAAVVAVWFYEPKAEAPVEASIIRPVKTVVIKDALVFSGRRYPGKVRAAEDVKLAFQVSGQLIELPIKRGQDVEKGALLARLDPRDFSHTLDAKKGVLANAKFNLDKVKELREVNAATPDELSSAQAALDVAEAEMKIAAKALKDTTLRAPFTGIVADISVENFENIRAEQPILSLQDISNVEIEINVPEERIFRSKGAADNLRFSASFDYLPDRHFEVHIKEYVTQADPATQTYAIRFTMPRPEEPVILPGMTATIQEYLKDTGESKEALFSVPVEVVPVDDAGRYFVWKLAPGQGAVWTVHKVEVKVGEMLGDQIIILEGVESGDRIAAAGVHLLQDGQQVTLLEDRKGGIAL
ncbi:MAG: efflux RND transporter periplasmic adaptor subunit [Phycisphaerales bacterium]|nr:efflux RND transporter periplasmic adaptor subunit [Phycisphaerales bacterium]